MIEKYLRHFGISDDAIDASLQIMDRAREMSETMDKGNRGLLLHGPQGRGKTTTATAIMRFEIDRFLRNQSPYRSVQFVFVPDLMIELQGCFSPGSEKIPGDIIYRMSEYDFLVLDGIGEGGRQSDFAIGAMGTLIHHREAARKTKRTIVTSNYSIAEIAERTDARIASRIASMCDEVPFSGSDRRLQR